MKYFTSDVCPSKTVTSDLGISHGWDVDVVQMSMGSGPIKMNENFHSSFEGSILIVTDK